MCIYVDQLQILDAERVDIVRKPPKSSSYTMQKPFENESHITQPISHTHTQSNKAQIKLEFNLCIQNGTQKVNRYRLTGQMKHSLHAFSINCKLFAKLICVLTLHSLTVVFSN